MNQSTDIKKDIILFGIPRSGSTWLSEVINQGNISRLHEPDNELISFTGAVFKRNLHRFPFISAKSNKTSLSELFNLCLEYSPKNNYKQINEFFLKLYGTDNKGLKEGNEGLMRIRRPPNNIEKNMARFLFKKKNERRKIIKSVHSFLSISHLYAQLCFHPVILTRHPLNVYSSYVKLNMKDSDRKLYDNTELLDYLNIQPIDGKLKSKSMRSGYQLGIFNKMLSKYKAEMSNTALFLSYETIISDPIENIKKLFIALELDFSESIIDYVNSRFGKGSGYQTIRRPEKQHEIWKKRLKVKQVDEFLVGYEMSCGIVDFRY